MLAVIGGTAVALLIAGSVWLYCRAELTVPPKDLRHRWRSGH